MRNTLYWWAPDFPGTGLYRVLSVSTSGSLGSGSPCGFSAFFHRSVSPTLQPEVRTFHSNADCQSGCDAPTQFTFLRQIPAESLNSLTVSSHDAGWLSTQSSFYQILTAINTPRVRKTLNSFTGCFLAALYTLANRKKNSHCYHEALSYPLRSIVKSRLPIETFL
ncbi:uncharacterized protein BDW43DRAFT_168372 [Aspergillus alliaceus]|uniref:uncharacterized protein n=1 Tax=Petromyces alliaceus TaxID=209559 RepID=UPI0012A66949|nr:uncharacterized protein BDW43DRAFT_168372 [Aspergillus alliaceus]KAB8230141.1 hypothetical protein BDW43DRAFT_168372 [Aspergillus alliaceus]